MTITVWDVTPYDIVHGTGMAEKRETSALKMETTVARNVGIYIYQTARRHITEGHNTVDSPNPLEVADVYDFGNTFVDMTPLLLHV
jgi:hypothetical protein